MASTSSNAVGRKPHQERAARRRAGILDAAAELIVEIGYEAVTMRNIATRAGASVGALYDYFPDKTSIAFALLNQYAGEIEAHWKPLIEHAGTLSHDEFAYLFIESMMEFLRERPAYLPVLNAPILYSRDPAARKAIRVAFADAFRSRNPSLTADHAFTAANIALQMVRGMTTLYTEAGAKERALITSEFKKILTFYLADVLSGSESASGLPHGRNRQKPRKTGINRNS